MPQKTILEEEMKTIDEDTTSVPQQPIEEGIGMTQLQKGGHHITWGNPQQQFQKN